MIISSEFMELWEDLNELSEDVEKYVKEMPKNYGPIECAWDKLPPEERMKPMLLLCMCPKCRPYHLCH